MFRSKILFLAVLFMETHLFGQGDVLKGKLVDSSTSEPIAFATIALKGQTVGVISNQDGGFILPERFNRLGDTLRISSMGYEKKEILISTLSTELPTTVYLNPSLFILEEAIVNGKKRKPLSARKIVRTAIEKIPENYPFIPFSTVGYYRDYQLKNHQYLNLNEAILEVFDMGFQRDDNSTTKVQIYDYKKNSDFERDTLADRPYNYKTKKKVVNRSFLKSYDGNEFVLLRIHNALRNYKINSYDYVNKLQVDLLWNHRFWKDSNTYVNDEMLYVLNFERVTESSIGSGVLFISAIDFAIHKMEYTVFGDTDDDNGLKKNSKKRADAIIFKTTISYKKNDGKMYLNYISFYNTFRIKKPSSFFIKDILVDLSRKRFEVNFNSRPDEKNVHKERNFNFQIKGKRINFEKLEVFGNRVLLYPSLRSEEEVVAFTKIAQLSEGDQDEQRQLSNIFNIKVKNLRDNQGNHLNRGFYEDFKQYREFFVQQVKPKTTFPKDVLFMNKDKPIFEDQPIFKPENFDDYWMNTPLKEDIN